MLRRIFLFFFAVVIIAQAVISVVAMIWLNSKIEVKRVDYFIENHWAPNSVLVNNQNQLWISYLSRIDVYQNRKLVRQFTGSEIGSQPDMLVLSPQGEVWNISQGTSGGISVFDGQKWTAVGKIEAEFASDAAVDRQGRVWLAASKAVYLYENGGWKQFNTSNSNIISDGANAITIDANDRIWVGTDKGVTYFDGQNWQVPSGSPAISVYSLTFAPNGDLWVGSESDGLFHFDGTEWTRYPVKKKSNNTDEYEKVIDILADKYGRVWIHIYNDVFYILDGQKPRYLGRGPTHDIRGMFIAPDGLIYTNDNKDVYAVSQDTRLLDEFEYSIKNLYDDGFILFTTLLLASIWVLTALQAWGMGTGITLGLATYVAASFFDVHGYINPGFTTTLTAFVGGMFGYFRQNPKTHRSTIIGSLAGYFSGVMIVLCCVGVILMMILLGGQ